MNQQDLRLAIIGLGYVGFPLAIEFSNTRDIIGFDLNKKRIEELQNNFDSTLEISSEVIRSSPKLKYTNSISDIKSCNCFIVTVPTPINEDNQPDLGPLISASKMIGSILKKDDIVIYESTVYPGATEEDCGPVLEEVSGLTLNEDFYLGYSPERINPGDKEHTLKNIIKITSGSTPEIANIIDSLYKTITKAGTHKAATIKIAEAAKVIENTQRDVNIALINELALIFKKLDIDTEAVLEAAGTKWNFLPFQPGLVGGHCIGVDPYYLTKKAQAVGYFPEIILAGRKLNDSMGKNVASQLIDKMSEKKISINQSNILILGITFKENCPDIRNSKVVDVISSLKNLDANVEVYDPWASDDQCFAQHQLRLISELRENFYDAVLIAVAHDKFREMGINSIRSFCKETSVIYDLKYMFSANLTDARL
jgi:UDP-N-acetyl-D-galactosamine dehydrogenase